MIPPYTIQCSGEARNTLLSIDPFYFSGLSIAQASRLLLAGAKRAKGTRFIINTRGSTDTTGTPKMGKLLLRNVIKYKYRKGAAASILQERL